MCHRNRLLLLLALLCVCFSSVSVSGQAIATDSFGVDSYIPERLSDLLWLVDGSLSFSGRGSDQNGYPRSSSYNTYDRGSEESSHRLNFSSQLTYEYVTVPRYLYTGVSWYNDFRTGSTESAQSSSTNFSGVRQAWSEDNTSYQSMLRARVDYGQYLVTDLFTELSLDYSGDYRGYPTADSRSENFVTEFYWEAPYVGWVSETRTDVSNERDLDDKRHDVELALFLGWGRQYDGRFAATSLNIIEELRQANLLDRELTFSEMTELTEIIYQYRQTHAVDYRVHRIEALQKVIDYLVGRQAISDPGPYGLLLIEDVYDYYHPFEARKFGWKVRLGFGLERAYYSRQEGNSRHSVYLRTVAEPDNPATAVTLAELDVTSHEFEYTSSSTLQPSLIGRFDLARPINLRWQTSGSITVARYLEGRQKYEIESQSETTDFDPHWYLSVAGAAEYFFDARTQAGLHASYTHTDGGLPRLLSRRVARAVASAYTDQVFDTKQYSLKLSANFTYRVSLPTSLWLAAGYGWSNEERSDSDYQYKYDSYSISTGIRHYIY